MKKTLIVAVLALMCCLLFAVGVSASVMPQKPQLDVEFGQIQTISGFEAPSQSYVSTTERVLLTDGKGGYVTYHPLPEADSLYPHG